MAWAQNFSVCIALVCVISAQEALAQEAKLDVQELYTQCKQPANSQAQIFCLGFISGIADLMQLNGQRQKSLDAAQWSVIAGTAFCAQSSYGAYVQVFVNWAQKHPEEWGERNFVGTVVALREAWPCPQNSN